MNSLKLHLAVDPVLRTKVRTHRPRAVVEFIEPRILFTVLDGSELIGLPSDMKTSLYTFIGDHSSSNSEIWAMNVGDRPAYTAATYGDVRVDHEEYKKGETYAISVNHVASNASEPDYDYRAWVDHIGTPTWGDGDDVASGPTYFVTEQNSPKLLQKQYFDDNDDHQDATVEKTAQLHIPALDLDVDSDNDNGTQDPARSLQEDVDEADSSKSKLIVANRGDFDGDGITDFADYNIDGGKFVPLKLSLSENVLDAAPLSDIIFTFSYSYAANPADANVLTNSAGAGRIRIWQKDADQSRTIADFIGNGATLSATDLQISTPGQTANLFIEGVANSSSAIVLTVTATVNGNYWSGTLTDSVRLRPVAADLRVDSNNSDLINDTDDDIEDDPSKPGKVIALNDDDDNGDGVADYADGSNDQSEWVPMTLTGPDVPNATYKFLYSASPPGGGSPTGHLRIWNPSTGLFIAPDTDYTAAQLGLSGGIADLRIEGVQSAGAVADGKISVIVDIDGASSPTVMIADVVTTLPTKPSLELYPTGAGTTGTLSHDNPDGTGGTPNFQGGWRFFPDAIDVATSTVSRNIIRLVAILPAIVKQNVSVFFRVFDVDDPSAVIAIDPNANGSDNRGKVTAANPNSPLASVQPGGGGYLGRLRKVGVQAFAAEGAIVEAKTFLRNDLIIAEVELATSFAPGDNYRVVASVDKKQLEVANLNDTTDVPTTGEVKKLAGVATEQISIWRRLHIEQDKMKKTGAAGAALGDTMSGNITVVGAPALNVVEVTTNLNIPALQANAYENGILRDANGVNYHIASNTTGANAKIKFLTTGGVPPVGAVTIYQDDFSASTSTRGNRFDGTVTGTAAGPNPGQFTVSTNKTLEANEFQGGMLYDTNGVLFSIVSNTAGANAQVVVTTMAAPANGGMSLFRQLTNNLPTTVVDTEDDSHLYDMLQETTVRAQNRFADSYIQPALSTLDQFDNVTTVGQTKISSTNTAIQNFANPVRGSGATENSIFWAVQVVTAFEGFGVGQQLGGKNVDNDAGGTATILEGQTDSTGNQSSIIFLETIRDGAVYGGDSVAESLAKNTIHEIGHQLNVANVATEHRPNPNSIMFGGGISSVPDSQFYFDPDDVAFLRFAHLTPGSR